MNDVDVDVDVDNDVDVIVLDLDGGEALTALIRSLEAQTVQPSRVLVWDNGSEVPARDRISQTTLPIEVYRSEKNLGFTGGINGAMGHVTAPLVAWINNDVVLEPDWIETMTGCFEDPAVGAAQSVIASSDGRIDGAGISIANGIFEQHLYRKEVSQTSLAAEPWGVSATAAMFRTSALHSVANGGAILNSLFFAYYEDVELAARMRDAGWKVRIEPKVLARHEGSRTASRLGNFGKRLRVRNRYFVRRLHPGAGSFQSLMAEDLGRFRWELRRGKFMEAIQTIAGVTQGLFAAVRD